MNRLFKFAQRISFVHPRLGKVNECFSSLNFSSINSAEDYVTVYKFPYIIPLSMVNRMKYYQTVLTATSLPFSLVLYKLNILDAEILKLVASIGITGCITLYSFGYLTNKLIGFIYFNNKEKLIQVAYIDFWGRRKDIVCPTSDIQLQSKSENKSSILGIYVVKVSTAQVLRINLKYGIILDESLYALLSNK